MDDMIIKAAGVDQIEWSAEHSMHNVMPDTAYTATAKYNGHPKHINYIEEYLDYFLK